MCGPGCMVQVGGRWWTKHHLAQMPSNQAHPVLKNQELVPGHQVLFWGKASKGSWRACRGRWEIPRRNLHRLIIGQNFSFVVALLPRRASVLGEPCG